MERFRLLVESSPDGILLVEDGVIVLANAAAARLLDVSQAEQLTGRSFLDSLDPDSRQRVREHIDRWRTGASTPPFDVKIASSREASPDVAVTGVLVQQSGGRQVLFVLRDVSERRAIDRAVREREERLTLAVAGGLVGIWDWDLETNAVVYSDRWKEMLGYATDEIEPHLSAWERLVHPDDRRRADRAHDSVANGDRTTYESEFRLRHKDGHYVHVLSRGFPVRREPGGPVVRIVGTHFDLTERKLAEAVIRENEERLNLAFAGAQEGVWDWNLETGSVVYSARWKEMLGYAEHEIEPHVRAWERLLHPDDVERAQQLNEKLANGATTYEGEFRLRHKDGHYVPVLSRGFPVRRRPGGQVVRIVGTHFDLTERKRAEAERARTELLTRLVFAQEDERRRIGREMHDQFGEHLTALSVRLRMLKDAANGNEAWRAHVESLEAIAQRLDRDVDHLVWELRPTALDDLGLRAALENYVQDWSGRVGLPAALHTSGLLDHRLPPDAETVLYRIAQEALTNVAKHARASKVDVILERRTDQVTLVVEDDGVGFDQAVRAQDGQASFGLIGMQERASLVGATLEIESAEGQGTTVLVRLALAPATEADHV